MLCNALTSCDDCPTRRASVVRLAGFSAQVPTVLAELRHTLVKVNGLSAPNVFREQVDDSLLRTCRFRMNLRRGMRAANGPDDQASWACWRVSANDGPR